jgi:hypothetical protein
MTDLHETNTPERNTQIDTFGWIFVAAVAIITAIAALAVYDGNETMVTNAPVSHVAASGG